jgi:2-polyprenyl-6-methoxyphenol hydroxylase-like FAD-dependent oxidoreductase
LNSAKVTIIGAGGGGSACSVGLKLKGFDVTLYNRSFSSRPRLERKMEIEYRGDLGGTLYLCVPLPESKMPFLMQT